MKQFFKPIPLALFIFSAWITVVCASLLSYDESGNLIAHSYSIWGDWSAHFTFISALKERGFSWIAGDNPLYPGTPFQYPFLSHVLTYLFHLVTPFGIIRATYISSLILMFAVPFVLYRFWRALKLSPFAAFCSVIVFLLIGGIQWLDSGLKPNEPLTNQFAEGSFFTQFILFEFFPQRAFLFGLVFLGLLGTSVLKTQKWTKKRIASLGLGLALLSLLHVHTWLAMGTLLLGFFLLPPTSILPKVDRKKILFFGMGVAAVSSVFLAFLLLRGNSERTWEIWAPFWAQNIHTGGAKAADMNVLWFWIYNTGIFLPLSLIGIWFGRGKRELVPFAIAGWILFFVALFFNIQPYYYDNLKLFTYAFFFLSPFVGLALEKITVIPKLPRKAGFAIALLVLGFQVTSAAIDMESFRKGLQSTTFFTREEFALANHFKELRDSPNSVVMINPIHNHWVPCLTGNPVSIGYGGWLWSWGVNYREREVSVQQALTNGPHALETIQKLNPSYIVVREGDRIADRPIDIAFLDSHFKRILSASGWIIYSAREASTSPSTSVR